MQFHCIKKNKMYVYKGFISRKVIIKIIIITLLNIILFSKGGVYESSLSNHWCVLLVHSSMYIYVCVCVSQRNNHSVTVRSSAEINKPQASGDKHSASVRTQLSP